MSLIKNEKLEGSRVELHFSIAQADYEAAVERVYRREVKKMNIPGRHPGIEYEETPTTTPATEELVALITKKVLEALGK